MKKLTIALVGLTGCMAGMDGALRESSVLGGVPCRQSDLDLDLNDYENGSSGWNWEVTCNGQRYACVRAFTGTMVTGVNSETKCNPVN